MSILRKLFKSKRKQVTGIDIGSGFIKVAEIDFSCSRPTLVAAGAVSLPLGAMQNGSFKDMALLAPQLQQLMLSAGCRSKHVVFGVGGQSVFAREVVYPVMRLEELKEAITWDIKKYIPYPADTYYYDFAIIGKSELNCEMKVFLAATPKEAVDALSVLANLAGLTIIAVDIDSLAAGRALGDPDSALLVDIGDSLSQITVFQGGCPVSARTVKIGGRHFTDLIMRALNLTYEEAELLKVRQDGLLRAVHTEEDTEVSAMLAVLVTELSREVVHASEYYKMHNKAAVIDKVVLSGGGAHLDNLVKHLESLLGMPVFLLDPFYSVLTTPAFAPQYIRGIAGQLTVAAGLSMWWNQT